MRKKERLVMTHANRTDRNDLTRLDMLKHVDHPQILEERKQLRTLRL